VLVLALRIICVFGSLVAVGMARFGLEEVVRTSSKLGFVGDVVLIEILRLLLGLLVVNGVGTGCAECQSYSASR
jgi:hypothetical protein